MDPTDEELIVLIEQAFADGVYPGDDDLLEDTPGSSGSNGSLVEPGVGQRCFRTSIHRTPESNRAGSVATGRH
jgi:hypothetical protein